MDVDQHLAAFIDAFVVPGRRERLHYVISHRGKKARQEGAVLMNHLDERFCKQVDGAFGLDAGAQGALYDFRHERASSEGWRVQWETVPPGQKSAAP
jgi:hypothetical protein